MTVVGEGPNLPHIEQLWAFLSVDADGDEGVCAFQNENGWMPLVAADEARVQSLRQVAELIAKESPGMKIVLARFSTRDDLETITSA